MQISLTPIKPKRRWNLRGIDDAIDEILKEEADKGNKLFEKATATFKHKTAMHRSRPQKIAYDREVHYGALKPSRKGNLFFSALNHGNDRYIYSLPPKKPMAWLPEYNPSTKGSTPFAPGKWSRGGDKKFVSRMVHQIIEPRRIDEAVAKRRQQYFPRVAKNRFNKLRYWV